MRALPPIGVQHQPASAGNGLLEASDSDCRYSACAPSTDLLVCACSAGSMQCRGDEYPSLTTATANVQPAAKREGRIGEMQPTTVQVLQLLWHTDTVQQQADAVMHRLKYTSTSILMSVMYSIGLLFVPGRAPCVAASNCETSTRLTIQRHTSGYRTQAGNKALLGVSLDQ